MKEKIKGFFNHRLIKYTIIFLIVAIFIEALLILNGRELIFKGDGLDQHYINLINYRRMLMNFIHGKGLSFFSWNINLGMDLFANYSYYIFGDLFNLLSLLSTRANLENLYEILIFARMYCIGLAFIAFAKYNKLNDNASVLGAILYTFCSYSLFGVTRHPFYGNGLILFPLLMIGIQKIVREDKKVFFTLIITITFLVSFYFGYMMSLCIAIYGIIIILKEKHQDGLTGVMKKIVQVGFYSLIGLGMSSVFLIPILNQFFDSSRTGDIVNYVYNSGYYYNLFTNIIKTTSPNNWASFCIGAMSLIIIPISFKKFKKYNEYLYLLLILLVPLLVPKIGSIFAGFAYPNSRWSFIIAFILAYLVAEEYNVGFKYNKKDLKIIVSFILIYSTIVVLFVKSYYMDLCITILPAVLFLLLCNYREKMIKNNRFNLSIYLIIVFGIALSTYSYFSVYGHNYLDEFIDENTANIMYQRSKGNIYHLNDAIDYIKKNDNSAYYRINKDDIGKEIENYGLYYDINTAEGYLSITNSLIEKMASDLDNYTYHTNLYINDFDQRTIINTILGNKYFISEKETNQYGYELIKEIGKTKIYKNKYQIPFGLLYTKYLDSKEYENLDGLEKENSLIKVVSLEKKDVNKKFVSKSDFTSNVKKVNIDIYPKNYKDIKIERINNIDNELTIKIDDKVKGELYLIIKDHDYYPFSKKEMIDLYVKQKSLTYNEKYLKSIANKQNRLYYPTKEASVTFKFDEKTYRKETNDLRIQAYKNYTQNHLIKLGYYDETINDTIKVTFNKQGIYKTSGIEVKEVSFKNYEKDIENLRRSNFEVIEYKNNYMIAKANPTENGVLQFSTIYDDSWDVYVDNKKVDTMKVNNYFLGIYIEKGEHNIKLVHHTKYMKEGLYITIASTIVFIACIIINKRKERATK